MPCSLAGVITAYNTQISPIILARKVSTSATSQLASLFTTVTIITIMFIAGIRFDHEEFEGRAKYDEYDPLDILNLSNQQGRDCQGHGTRVAALAAGKTFGAAKGATVYSTRVISCNGRGSYTPIILGISHVIEQKVERRDRRIVINMSLGGPTSVALHDSIRQATDEGILVVVAAGNQINDACR